MSSSGIPNQKESNDIKQAINDLTNMIEGKQMRLEAILSQIMRPCDRGARAGRDSRRGQWPGALRDNARRRRRWHCADPYARRGS